MSLEKIEQEYSFFKERFLNKVDNVDVYIKSLMFDCQEIKGGLKRELGKVKIGLVWFKFLRFLGVRTQETYLFDEEAIYKLALEYERKYSGYLRMAKKSLNDDNAQEITLLLSFSAIYHNSVAEHYDNCLERIDCLRKGFQYNVDDTEDESELFDQFFRNKISVLTSSIGVEKVKKV